MGRNIEGYTNLNDLKAESREVKWFYKYRLNGTDPGEKQLLLAETRLVKYGIQLRKNQGGRIL